MNSTPPTESDLGRYEGLVRKTAGIYAPRIGEEYEDFCQILRLKVYEALLSYDPSRSKLSERNYVFSCVLNRVKDFQRKEKVRKEQGFARPVLIEDVAPTNGHHDTGGADEGQLRDRFEHEYLSTDPDLIVETLAPEVPTIPSTLDRQERRVIVLLYTGWKQVEIGQLLGLNRSQIIRVVGQIRTKMADWDPGLAHSEDAVPEAIAA